MKLHIVAIGNSKGVRIPKTVLQQCDIKESVDLQVKGKMIIIKPCVNVSRVGWDRMFKDMAKAKDDRLVINDDIECDMEDWQW